MRTLFRVWVRTLSGTHREHREAMVLSGEAAEVFSCRRQPADSGTTAIIQPRSGDSVFVMPAKIEADKPRFASGATGVVAE
jgi:hypothetical protein